MTRKKPVFSTKAIAIHGVLAAIILLFYAIPMNFVGAQIVFLPLIAVSVSALYLGPWHGFLSGLFMGLVSCVGSLISPASPLALLFRYPWISVLPKALFPIACYWTSRLVGKFVKNPVPADLIGSLVGALTNTALTLGFILLFYNGVALSTDSASVVISPAVILPLLTVNAAIEAVLTALLTPTIVFALKKAIPNPLETKPSGKRKKTVIKERTEEPTEVSDVSSPTQAETNGAVAPEEGSDSENNEV